MSGGGGDQSSGEESKRGGVSKGGAQRRWADKSNVRNDGRGQKTPGRGEREAAAAAAALGSRVGV